MLDEIAKVVAEDVIATAFSGACGRAQSRKANRLKWAAWAALMIGVAGFVVAFRMEKVEAVLAGCLAFLFFFVLGIWAAVVNARIRSDGT